MPALHSFVDIEFGLDIERRHEHIKRGTPYTVSPTMLHRQLLQIQIVANRNFLVHNAKDI